MAEHMSNTDGNPGKAARNLTMVEDRIKGMTCREIGKKHDLSYGQAANILRSKDIKPLIDKTFKDLVSLGSDNIHNNYADLIKSDNESIKLKATQDLVDLMGMKGDRTSPVLNQFIQINQVNAIDQALSTAYHSAFGDMDSTIDVEPGDQG